MEQLTASNLVPEPACSADARTVPAALPAREPDDRLSAGVSLVVILLSSLGLWAMIASLAFYVLR